METNEIRKNPKKNSMMEFLKGSSALVISNVLLKAMNFFLLPLYTKYLTPDQLGITDSVTNLTSFLFPILTLGLDSAFSAFYFEKEEPDRGKRVFSTISLFFVMLGGVALLLSLFSGGISNILFHTDKHRWLIAMAFFSTAVNLWFLPYSLELRMKNRMMFFGIANVTASFFMILLNILFVAVFNMGEQALVLSSLIANIIQMALLILFVKKTPKAEDTDKQLLKKMLKYSLPLVPMSVLNWVLALSDRYVLLHYHGEGVVGIYGISLRFVTVLNVVISAVSMAYTTFAFQVKNDDEDAKKKYYYVFQVESFLLMAICFTVTLFGPEVISLMSSNEAYNEAAVSLRDLLFAQTIFAMSGIVGYGINFAKKSGYYLVAVSCGAVVNLGLNLFLIPEFGMKAAAATTLIGYLIVFILVYIFSERLYPCKYGVLRVGIVMAVLYTTCIILDGTPIWVRAIVWVVEAAGAIAAFRDILTKMYHFLRDGISRKKAKP